MVPLIMTLSRGLTGQIKVNDLFRRMIMTSLQGAKNWPYEGIMHFLIQY